ncbi:Glucoside xylosyltransferase 1 [Chionoecetes opilio]|uniref:UDP-D-xylose:beta-D-glucoside alpha-1,3-D-xylosyltransferase n=1 Tax=Chionoecetes opilio TaxID=41210 RepID=A0A8J5BU11_CHIOP|nr:Glucoside xylosyltransferase 1 [Chionoecetes opilio]
MKQEVVDVKTKGMVSVRAVTSGAPRAFIHLARTFNSVAPNMKEEIFQRIVKEMKALIRQETEERDNSQDMEAMEEHEEVSADPFAELCDTTQADQEDDLEEDIKKELLAWKRSKEATLKKSHFPAKYRDQWVTLFIKYNTGIPSSAAVERLFSTAGDVLRPKRACLSEDNFEYLVFLKGNLHLLKQKFKARVRATPVCLCSTVLYSTLLMMMLSYTGLNLGGDWLTHVSRGNTSCCEGGVDQDRKDDVVFFIILCEEKNIKENNKNAEASSITRQLRQAAVMVKSAAALTSKTLRFLVVADSKELYHRFTDETSEWPKEYQRHLAFEWHPVWYPREQEDMRTMFRTCATERLFLPEMFPNLDAAIYIDTDLIFLRPPEELWQEFHKFDAVQVAAMAPCLYHYGTSKNVVPYYGQTGLNAGVMHMNLTRMKNFPGKGWVSANMKVFNTFRKKIKLADQDILNILFHKYPEHLYELGCEWNYRIFQCSKGNKCPAAAASGISILHGNAMSFVNGKEMKLQTVFEAWESHQLGEPLSLLVTRMEQSLKYVSSHGLPSKCSRIPHIDDMLTKELKKYVLLSE